MQPLLPRLHSDVPESLTVTNKLPTEPAPPGLAYYVASSVEWSADDLRLAFDRLFTVYDFSIRGFSSSLEANPKAMYLHRVTAAECDRLYYLGWNTVERYTGGVIIARSHEVHVIEPRPRVPLQDVIAVQRLVQAFYAGCNRMSAVFYSCDPAPERREFLVQIVLQFEHSVQGYGFTNVNLEREGDAGLFITFSCAGFDRRRYRIYLTANDPLMWVTSSSLDAALNALSLLWPSQWTKGSHGDVHVEGLIVNRAAHPRARINEGLE